MELGFEWLTDLLGLQQSVAQFGTQQTPLQSFDGVAPIKCSTFLAANPPGFEKVSLAIARDNLAVVPVDWLSSGIIKPWYSIESHDSFTQCLTSFRHASFVAFHEDFLDFIGTDAKLETIYTFTGHDAEHVHEAPVYVSWTNELVFADTSVMGWLWALEVDTHHMRKINTDPPLENVNGATTRDSRIYLATNGGRAPAVWNCSLPVRANDGSDPETIDCVPVVNNYRLTHLNSPNDLVFTSQNHILFTDPTYGWTQGWPGLGAPELPTAIYHFNTRTRALTALHNDEILQPNGLALSLDEKTLYVAESNSTSGKPINVWEDSVRNVYAFDFDETDLRLDHKRLIHVVESGWPDGLRLTSMDIKTEDNASTNNNKKKKEKEKNKSPLTKRRRDLLLVACMGGVDVVDVSRGFGAGILLGKFNVGDDIVFNLEPADGGNGGNWKSGTYARTWLLTGRKGVYKVSL